MKLALRQAFPLVVAVWFVSCGGKSTVNGTADAGLSDATGSTGGLDAARLPGPDVQTIPVGEAGTPPPSPAACDPGACSSGCCGSTGCLAGTSPTTCGFGGQACTDCTALGLDCVPAIAGNTGGVCGSLDAGTTPDGSTACGPANCAGCCPGGMCVSGTTGGECGSHGQACTVCTGTNRACVVQGTAGACVGSGPCSPSNCSGCCDSNGICQEPAEIAACGSAGSSCQFLPAGASLQQRSVPDLKRMWACELPWMLRRGDLP
jgi:hypothetical protein